MDEGGSHRTARSSTRAILVVVLTCLLLSPPFAGERAASTHRPPDCPAFTAPITHVSGFAQGVAVADIDGDGDSDLMQTNDSVAAIAERYRNALVIYPQEGSGRFEFGRTMPLHVDEATSGPLQIATGRLDGDDIDDIAVATTAGLDVAYSADDAGGFELVREGKSSHVKIADMDGDGRPDIVWNTEGGLKLLYNKGDRTFDETTVSQEQMLDVQVSDVTADGATDIVGGTESGVSVFSRGADGVFNRSDRRLTDDEPPDPSDAYVAVGDLTGDDRNDVVWIADQQQPVLLPQGDGGTWGEPRHRFLPLEVHHGPAEIADMNGDGKNDLVQGESSYSSLRLFLGTESEHALGSCGAVVPGLHLDKGGLDVGDVNQDGLPDIVLAGLTVLQQRRSYVARYVSPVSLVTRSKGKKMRVDVPLGRGSCTTRVFVQRYTRGKWRTEGRARWHGGYIAPRRHPKDAYRAVVAADRPNAREICVKTTSTILEPEGGGPVADCPRYDEHVYPMPAGLNAEATGDFDSDGKTDVVVGAVTAESAHLVIFRGKGDGELEPHEDLDPSPRGVSDLEAGDFDGDGDLDLATADGDGILFYMQSEGRLQPGPRIEIENGATSVAAAHLDGDGALDVSARAQLGGYVIWYGPGFDRSQSLGYGASDQIVDVNEDGRLDFARRGTRPAGALQDADGRFWYSERLYPFADAGLLLDVTGDRHPDWIEIASSIGFNPPHAGALWIERGTATHRTGQTDVVSIPPSPEDLSAGDVTGDGRRDVAVVDGTGEVSVIRQRAGGLDTACPYRPVRARTNAIRITIADLDGDAPKEIIVYASQRLAVLDKR